MSETSTPAASGDRRVLRVDGHERNVVWERGPYFITVDDPQDARYIALWKEGTRQKIGDLSLGRGRNHETRRFLTVHNVGVQPNFRGQGLGLELYRTALRFLGEQWAGLGSEGEQRSNKRQVPKIYRRLGGRLIEGNWTIERPAVKIDATAKPMKLPIEPDNLPSVDQLVLDAVCVEHQKSTTSMGRTLESFGWTPEQTAHVEDKWSWTWIARAVVAERFKRDLSPAPPDIRAELLRATTPTERRRTGAVPAPAESDGGMIRLPRPPGDLVYGFRGNATPGQSGPTHQCVDEEVLTGFAPPRLPDHLTGPLPATDGPEESHAIVL